MLETFSSSKAIGLEWTPTRIKGAEASFKKGSLVIHRLFNLSFPIKKDKEAKLLYRGHPFILTSLDGSDVLVRSLHMPLTKEKDIDAALTFQAEPLLPYSVEQAVLTKHIKEQSKEGTDLTLASVRKDLLQNHLEHWKEANVEPEKVTSIQIALSHFCQAYIKTDKPYLLLHINESFFTCILLKDNKIIHSYTHQEGLSLLDEAYEKDLHYSVEAGLTPTPIDFSALSSLDYPCLIVAFQRLQQALHRMIHAFAKELKGELLEGLLITGDAILLPQLDVALAHRFELPLLSCHAIDSMDQLSTQEKQQYAVSIGLACSNFSAEANAINFRKGEFAYPHPWKRMKRPLLSYFALIALLSTAFYFYGQAFLRSQENEIKHNYLSLLASMNKSYEDFETFFTKKTGNYISAEDLKKEDIFNRLESLQKDLKATPDSFPLFPNTPRLSDVLGWLNQHPNINHKKEDGSIESRLKVEKLIYTMVKRPIQGKKQERYQVKVELDLSSPVATWAREFHDALITPNDFVDPKGEIKWNTNKGLYQTSFYLKDKTYYFGQ